MELLLILAGAGAMSVAAYFHDLFTSLSELDDPRGADAMEKMLEGYAIAEIVTLAIMADGELTHAEMKALRQVTADVLGDPDEAVRCISALRFRGSVAGDWDGVADLVRRSAKRLSEAQREETFRLVVELAKDGTGLPGEVGYRTYSPTDPDGLLDAIAAGLDLGVSQQIDAGRRL